jgi:hypothetical protein
MQRMAPIKKAEKTPLSGQETTSAGWHRNQIKMPRKKMEPLELK